MPEKRRQEIMLRSLLTIWSVDGSHCAGKPDFAGNGLLAYILLICVRNKSAALPCDPLRHWLHRGSPVCGRQFFVRRAAAASHSFVTIEDDHRVIEFIFPAPP